MRPLRSPASALAPFAARVRVGLALLVPLAVAALAGLGCDRAPSAEGLKEWTPADHDGEKSTANAKQGPKGDGGGAPALADITWRTQCASCHGPTGHGDGPQGAMFKASDLSREEWQSKIKDEEIAGAIVNGKGRMPKFELPEEVVKGLVVRVRSFRGN
jgi:cytochrome c oxidase cbb3-type subunit 3